MARPKNTPITPSAPLSDTHESLVGPTLTRRDAVAVEFARAYILHNGVIRPDVIKAQVVASADELAKQLGWDDHL